MRFYRFGKMLNILFWNLQSEYMKWKRMMANGKPQSKKWKYLRQMELIGMF